MKKHDVVYAGLATCFSSQVSCPGNVAAKVRKRLLWVGARSLTRSGGHRRSQEVTSHKQKRAVICSYRSRL